MTQTTSGEVELRIPPRPEFVGVVRLTVSAVASRLGFGFDDIEDIKVAVGEALTNAIQHAAEDARPDDDVVVSCRMGADELTIEVRDRGKGFDPEQVRLAEAGEGPPESGLGLLLIETLMDQVEFETRPDRGTQVRMIKRRTR
jgi:serine/threonine-protein kinase RsbW